MAAFDAGLKEAEKAPVPEATVVARGVPVLSVGQARLYNRTVELASAVPLTVSWLVKASCAATVGEMTGMAGARLSCT